MFSFDQIFTISFTLFAVIDILGSIPILLSLREKIGEISAAKATLASGVLMVVFLLVGEQFLKLMSVDVQSFAVAGSIVIFVIGLEMILGIEFLRAIMIQKQAALSRLRFRLSQDPAP
ncbi:MarC family protein [Chitinophaga sedimenti]|uniref:MarC family protein n=1 Tax=Chitinophaga sedimenti TaxID=2033606 RepID=UPI00249E35BD|nr:MarC family protein [Chitinophaga sedimenti]